MGNQKERTTTGYVHSIETFAALDGPGLRTVIFIQGCPLKCKFCHNIDCALKEKKGDYISAKNLVKKILKNKPYWESCNVSDRKCRGGVTLSGGDPVFQPKFTLDILKELKKHQIHTAVDTSLYTSHKTIDSWLPFVDLWMVSLKHMNSAKHRELTSVDNKRILENIVYLDSKLSDIPNKNKDTQKLRIRFLVIPTITDDPEHIRQVGKFVSKIQNLEVLEILKYGSHGKHKWIEIFGKYELEGVPEAEDKDIERALKILENYKLPIKK
ncbi:radical SAM protein [Candidatus Dojkabacteria bacterium]|nr:radical SAM protein [Candidatus Dojkabacteria bacterium]